ncbi:calcium/sodium antiporter [Agromyces bauzanensis]|uniref:calcium/sodium antiporter n=1 Tax=Agromyces bauzanensis TaxID=1308924 RepID=UPI001E2C6C11|nr:calcium/sodium antiporter [Agromyces bauzanensis]
MTGFWLFLVGLLATIGGAELLVRGGTRLAARLGISPMVIGVTVVSLGTSTPELAIGIDAALQGSSSLALGNIAGTNTLNLLLILGLAAVVQPLTLRSQAIRLDLPIMVAAAAALFLVALDGVVTRLDGGALIALGLLYSVLIVRAAHRETVATRVEFAREFGEPRIRAVSAKRRTVRDVIWLVAGIGVIVVGANWLVNGAVDLARGFGVSDAFIGLTVVAIGTSAPELVTAIVATIRRERDIAVGNLIGSSVFNIVFIFGVTSLIPSDGIRVDPEIIAIDLPVMVAATVACIPVFLTGNRMRRLEGAAFVAAYVVYLGTLVFLRT